METVGVVPRIGRDDSITTCGLIPFAYLLDREEVSESAFWEAVRVRVPTARADSSIQSLLASARDVSGMDSTFLVRSGAIARCVNGGPLRLVQGQPLPWIAAIREELVSAGSWQTHALDRERRDAPPGLPLRVKTLFVLPVNGVGTAEDVVICGISQMRVVMDMAQREALDELSVRLSRAIGDAAHAPMRAARGQGARTASGHGKSRKPARKNLFGHVFGGRDAVTRRISQA